MTEFIFSENMSPVGTVVNKETLPLEEITVLSWPKIGTQGLRNILLFISFDGTNYHGWQVQKNAPSVQKTMQDALEQVIKSRPDLVGCSRTDAGVHANEFACNFYTSSVIDCPGLQRALNSKLPDDISVLFCRDVGQNFHARYSAVGKEYVYKIYQNIVRSPFLNNYALFYPYSLDLPAMSEAAKNFLGRHDFSAFCATGGSVEDKVRTVEYFEIRKDGSLVTMTVRADGFLYNMVRIMAGTLLYVSQGKITPEGIGQIIASRDRSLAGPTVPAHGLYLNRVFYGDKI
jgi:tRNA pseudouridine38-40 synthase